MSDRTVGKGANSSVVAKAGTWYTICNFLFRGMAFITTPIFARILSKAELGDFNNFASWLTILIVLTALDVQMSIIRSKLEVGDDMDSYIWSILSMTTMITVAAYGVVMLFPTFFSNLLLIEPRHFHLLFLYLLFTPAYSMLITKQRAYYKYKMFVLLTGICLVTSTLCSLVLVLLMEDKLTGRMYGFYIPQIVMGAVIYVYLLIKGKKIQTKYWKYACAICLPLVPHVLSLHLLCSSDKIIIKRISGSEYAAVYGIAYSCYHIVTILFDSMNKAFAPWLLESLHHEKYGDIRKVSKIYVGIFLVLSIGVLMLVPELILILGGKKYAEANYCLPPLIASCVFQFIYTMYVNVEFYEKKTIGVACATMIATAVNIILNFIFIPMYPEKGFVIAAYTTLVGYALLFVLHYFLVRRMKKAFVFDTKFMIAVQGLALAVSFVMNLFYGKSLSIRVIRYALVTVYGSAVLYVAFRNKDRIIALFKQKKKKKEPAPQEA